MADNLQDLITKALGVAPAVPETSPSASLTVPPRPKPIYEYRISVTRTEYGAAYIYATSAQAAFDKVTEYDLSWDDAGDIDWDDALSEQQGQEPDNQDALDEWDDTYGNRYTAEGRPKCSACEAELSETQLTLNLNNDNEWFCTNCYHNNVIYP